MKITWVLTYSILIYAALPSVLCSQEPDIAHDIAVHLSKAQEDLRQNKPALAIPELQIVANLDPSNAQVRGNLGVLEFFQGQYAEAKPELKFAVQSQPDLWRIRALLGVSERRLGEERAGRADLDATYPHIEDQKLKLDVGRELIESYAATEEFDKASALIGELLKIDPTDPKLLYISYRIHSQMATAAMLELGLAAPESAQTHQAMAHEVERDRDLAGAIANLRRALELDPNLPGAHFELAEVLHASDDTRLRGEAEEQYRLALTSNPSDFMARTRIGDIEAEQRHLDDAETCYREALRLRPDLPDANIGLANILAEQGKAAEAATLLMQVVATDPTNYRAHYRLSAVYRQLKRPDEVRRQIELYERYKDEHDRLMKVYAQMRVLTPDEQSAEKQK